VQWENHGTDRGYECRQGDPVEESTLLWLLGISPLSSALCPASLSLSSLSALLSQPIRFPDITLSFTTVPVGLYLFHFTSLLAQSHSSFSSPYTSAFLRSSLQSTMPAIRTNTPSSSQSTSPPGSKKSVPGWSQDQKSALFNHVLKFGEKDWKVAVPGKTGHQVSQGACHG